MSIKDLGEKIKSIQAVAKNSYFASENSSKYYTVAVIILVGLSSFGLGRLSVIKGQNSHINIEKKSVLDSLVVDKQSGLVADAVPDNGAVKSGQYVASRNGSKYYFPWCGGANNISEANKIWFKSTEEAKSKGYVPASNCKGLK